MRIRLTFSKTSHMRFTGHMDLHRALDRTLRRAQLPLSTSKGFTRRTRMNIASALPLGVTGERELADVWLDEALSPESFEQRFSEAAPPGIWLHHVVEIPEDAPKLQKLVRASDFEVTLLDSIPELDERISALLEKERVERVRRGKPYDLRPLILDLSRLTNNEDGCQRLAMRLQTQESATGRADEVVAALGGDPLAARYTRKRILLDPT
jgi:radical SAM-linked protein